MKSFGSFGWSWMLTFLSMSLCPQSYASLGCSAHSCVKDLLLLTCTDWAAMLPALIFTCFLLCLVFSVLKDFSSSPFFVFFFSIVSNKFSSSYNSIKRIKLRGKPVLSKALNLQLIYEVDPSYLDTLYLIFLLYIFYIYISGKSCLNLLPVYQYIFIFMLLTGLPESNGYIYVEANGGLNQQRTSVRVFCTFLVFICLKRA